MTQSAGGGYGLDPRIRTVAAALARRPVSLLPDHASPRSRSRAAVALVVRPESTDLELLLIRRAMAPGDPWSGHMALPGGRWSPGDATSLETAMRETQEEVGVDLRTQGTLLGQLDDVRPRAGAPPVAISPFVFAVPPGTSTTVNHEVDLAVWIPVRRLAAPGAATEYLYALASGEHLRFPAIGYEDFVIWGLTHRILSQFIDIAGAELEQGERGE